MPKILLFNDPHFRGTSPVGRKDDFQETLVNKIEEIIRIAHTKCCDAIVITGDVFDRPDTKYSVIRRFGKILRKSKIPIYTAIGNHDVFAYNTNTLKRTALGILEGLGVVNIIPQKDNSIFIKKDGITLQITATHFHHELDKRSPRLDYYAKKHPDADYLLHVVHGNLVPNKLVKNMAHTLIENIETEADVIATGHFHPGFGLVKRDDGKYFINKGSIVRISAALSEFKRKIVVTVIDFNKSGINFEDIELQSAKKAEEVLNRKHIELKRKKEEKLESFYDEIKKIGSIKKMTIENIIERFVNEENIEQEVKEVALNIIGEAQENLKNVDLLIKNNIKKLIIENFQSHKYTVIDFDENGVNVIVGETDVGKSAILRALYFLLFNKYQGDWFIRTGESECRVTAEFSDGSIISRVKSKSKNRYITIINGEKQVYEGFRNTVPEEVMQIHGLRDLYLDDKNKISLSISEQLNGHSILNLPDSLKAKLLGVLSGVEAVDIGLQINGSNINEINSEIKVCMENIKELQEDLKEYEDLTQMKENITNWENKLQKIKELDKKIEKLTKLKEKYDNVNNEILKTQKLLKSLKVIPNLKLKYYELDNKNNKIKTLSKFADKYEQLNKSINTCKTILEKTQNITDLKNKYETLKEKEEKILKFTDFKNRYDILKGKIKYVNSILEKTRNLYKQRLKINEIELKNEKIKRLENIKSKVEKFKIEIKKVKLVLKSTENIEVLKEKLNKAEIISERIEKLNQIKVKVNNFTHEYKKVKAILIKTQNIEMFKEKINKLETLEKKLNKLIPLFEKYEENRRNTEKGKKFMKQNLKQLDLLLEQYKKLLIKLETCPVCESRIDYNVVQKIVNEYKKEVI